MTRESVLSESVPMSNVQSSKNMTLTFNIDPDFSISTEELKKIFIAKCKDFGAKYSDKMFDRFQKNLQQKDFSKVYHMEKLSIGPEAAGVVARSIEFHPNIRIVLLGGNTIGNEGAKAIAGLISKTQTVISIDLSGNSIGNEGSQAIFMALRQNKTIVNFQIGSIVGLNRNTIDTSAAIELKNMLTGNKVLAELNISMVEINSETIEPIAEGLSVNQTLQVLNVSNNNIASRGANLLIKGMISSNLLELNISGNHIKDDIGNTLANFLNKNNKLIKLDLSSNNLTGKFLNTIQLALTNNLALQELNISKNPIGGKGIASLGKVLEANMSLRTIIAANCKIDTAGIKEFSEHFRANNGLSKLNLNNNPLREDGINALALAIDQQNGLRELFLDLTELTDKAAENLCDVLSKSTTICKLSLKNNLIKKGASIHQLITTNHNIRFLNADYNDIDYRLFSEIERLVQINHKEYAEGRQRRQLSSLDADEIDQQLFETRQSIKQQRDYIEKLKDDAKSSCKEMNDTKSSMLKNITQLEIIDRGADKTLRTQTQLHNEEYDKAMSNLTNTQAELEVISNVLNSELEKFKSDISRTSSINRQMEAAKEEHAKQMEELQAKLKDIIMRYRMSKEMFDQSLIRARNPGGTEEPVKEPESPHSQKSKKSKHSSKKGKKSKKSKKSE